MSAPALALALCLGAAAPGSVEATARRLVSELTLPSVTGFDLDQDLAVGAVGRGAALDAIADRVAGFVAQLGARRPVLLAPSPDLARAAERARAAGAEWLLLLERDGPRVVASLRAVEPDGLWGPAPARPASFAQAALELGDPEPVLPAPPAGPPPEPASPLSAPGPALKIAEVEARVLALAACRDPDEATPERLAVLTEAGVRLYEDARGHLRPVMDLAAGDRPRARTPVRDPVGQLVCRGRALAFGHGRLERGYLLDLEAPDAPWRPLPGIPHGFDREGRLLVSGFAGGTNVLSAPPVWVRPGLGGAEAPATEAWPPAFARGFDADRPQGWRAVALGIDGRWWRAGGAVAVETGYGASLRALGGSLVAVSTARRLDGGRDRVRVWDAARGAPLGPPLEIEGEVHASAIVRRFEGKLGVLLAAWRPELSRTDLLLVPLEGSP